MYTRARKESYTSGTKSLRRCRILRHERLEDRNMLSASPQEMAHLVDLGAQVASSSNLNTEMLDYNGEEVEVVQGEWLIEYVGGTHQATNLQQSL